MSGNLIFTLSISVMPCGRVEPGLRRGPRASLLALGFDALCFAVIIVVISDVVIFVIRRYRYLFLPSPIPCALFLPFCLLFFVGGGFFFTFRRAVSRV